MEAKLIKRDNDFYSLKVDGFVMATSNGMLVDYNLSLKNCQAIQNGYDLDELAESECKNSSYNDLNHLVERGFKIGFQKALEVNSDKRFTFKEMVDCWNKALNFQEHKETLGDHMQSLQQTEWDVEVEMICPHPMDTYRCGLQYGCDQDGCNHPNQVPYLDADGCLILKRKVCGN